MADPEAVRLLARELYNASQLGHQMPWESLVVLQQGFYEHQATQLLDNPRVFIQIEPDVEYERAETVFSVKARLSGIEVEGRGETVEEARADAARKLYMRRREPSTWELHGR
ncbi:hypothetical protein SEA_SCENTAE_224 [Gordonia phage SCentae]|nr:hypothetical protein SEA_SCENTAE_224 [Gordonia phage SCentae]